MLVSVLLLLLIFLKYIHVEIENRIKMFSFFLGLDIVKIVIGYNITLLTVGWQIVLVILLPIVIPFYKVIGSKFLLKYKKEKEKHL